jgi:hypothetical protein
MPEALANFGRGSIAVGSRLANLLIWPYLRLFLLGSQVVCHLGSFWITKWLAIGVAIW